MDDESRSVEQVLSQLQAEGYLASDWREQAVTTLSSLEQVQPWYVRTMVGFGAWLASLLLIAFIMSVNFISTEGGRLIFGLVLIAAAMLLRRLLTNGFSHQFALVMSLAGQVFVAIGVTSYQSGEGFAVAMLTLIMLNSVLVLLYPDSVHRFLSVIIIVSSIVGLLYYWRVQFLLPWLTLMLTAVFIYLALLRPDLIRPNRANAVAAIMTGLMTAAYACVMLSTVYVMPELVRDFEFYPNPWIATLGCGLGLLHLESNLVSDALEDMWSRVVCVVYGMTLLLILATLPAPGLLFSLIVMMLGVAQGNRLMTGSGLVFLAVFTTAFFYGIETSLLMKSVILVIAGTIILLGRWLLLNASCSEPEQNHA